jgi:uncharacterized protein YjbJ (UPF0337 family)
MKATEEMRMAGDGKTDKAKGRLKEKAGDLTDRPGLKNEGKVDRAAGAAKDKVGSAADKVKDTMDRK